MAKKSRDRRNISFWDHVDELRAAIIWCVSGIVAFAVAGWVWRVPLLDLLRRPAEVGAMRVGIEDLPFRVFEPVGGFMIAIQIALLAGIVGASPIIIWQVWRFFAPALEDNELKHSWWVLPLAVLLFVGGVAFCYFVSPNAFAFLFKIDLSLGVGLERTLQPYLWFMMRLMLAFGLAFELPLVLMFLGLIGLVNSKQLRGWWRQAIVVIFVFAAIVTPTVDPVNMTILAAPMFLLYLLSILLVRLVQPKETPEEEADDDFDITEAEPSEGDPSLATYEEAATAEQEAEELYDDVEGELIEPSEEESDGTENGER